jgi:murein DD-endopeptidase MepM/ murein hydrolase activator NlpD
MELTGKGGVFGALRHNRKHKGADFYGKRGDPVRAPFSGKIVEIGWLSDGHGYGIVIQDCRGYKIRFAHFNEDSSEAYGFKKGDIACKGNIVGNVGSSGKTSSTKTSTKDSIKAPHLHVEVEDPNGNLIDPLIYFRLQPIYAQRGPSR